MIALSVLLMLGVTAGLGLGAVATDADRLDRRNVWRLNDTNGDVTEFQVAPHERIYWEQDSLVRATFPYGSGSAVPSAGAWQDLWQKQVQHQMRVAFLAMGMNDYRMDLFEEGRLNDGTVQRWTLNVGNDRSRTYKIVAACDEDCGDIDLELYEMDGTQVDEDLGQDALPVVTVPRGHTGDHVLNVTMYNCSVGPCRYGYAVFSALR